MTLVQRKRLAEEIASEISLEEIPQQLSLGQKMCHTIGTGVRPRLICGRDSSAKKIISGAHSVSSKVPCEQSKEGFLSGAASPVSVGLRIPGPSSSSWVQKPILTAFREGNSDIDLQMQELTESLPQNKTQTVGVEIPTSKFGESDRRRQLDPLRSSTVWQDTTKLVVLQNDADFMLSSSCQGAGHSDCGVVSLAQVPSFGARVYYPEPAPRKIVPASQLKIQSALPEESEINDRHEIETNRDVERLLEQVPELVAFRQNKQLENLHGLAHSHLHTASQVSWNPNSHDLHKVPSYFTFQ